MNRLKFGVKSKNASLVAVATVAMLLGARHAQAQTTVTVYATDVIYAAGGQTGALDGTGGTTPSFIDVTSGESLTFSVTGSVTLNSGGNDNDADGVGAAPGTSYESGYGSISGITANGAGYLVGVFIRPSAPGPAPSPLDFTSTGTSFTSLSLQLVSGLFIGDGLTGDGAGSTQVFYAPSGAATLYLGISRSAITMAARAAMVIIRAAFPSL